MLLNGSAINGAAINGSAAPGFEDWTAELPVERQAVYVLEIGGLRVPISSAQATMRLNPDGPQGVIVGGGYTWAKSFLEVVVPNASAWADDLADKAGRTMILRGGFRYPDGTFSREELIAIAGFNTSRRSTGPTNDTITMSGYADKLIGSSLLRSLTNVQTRTIDQNGRRRVRCAIDLFLRPGHLAMDADGTVFTVGTIQYFINASTEAMEVIEDG